MLPCIDSYKKIDLRVVSFDVPPQEASSDRFSAFFLLEIFLAIT